MYRQGRREEGGNEEEGGGEERGEGATARPWERSEASQRGIPRTGSSPPCQILSPPPHQKLVLNQFIGPYWRRQAGARKSFLYKSGVSPYKP